MTLSPRTALALLTLAASAACGTGAEEDGTPGSTARAATADTTLRSGGGSVALASLGLSSTTVPAGGRITATVTLTGPAQGPAGGVVVYVGFQSTLLAGPRFVLVPNGESSATFTLHGNPFAPAPTATSVSATTSSPQPFSFLTQSLAVVPSPTPPTSAPPRLASLTLNPATVATGSPATGTVTLTEPAPAGGAAVQLSNPADFLNREADPPPVVIVPAGLTSATFTVRTHLSSGVSSADVIVVGSSFGSGFQGAHLIIAR